MAYQGNDL